MRFRMYGFDKNDESIFSRFKKEGIDAVVWVKNDEAMKKAEDTGLSYYICMGAFGSSDEKEFCINVNGKAVSWFSSGCPNRPEIQKRCLDKAEELARLPHLKGIIIDGARFSSPASGDSIEAFLTCLCPYCVSKMERLGMNTEGIKTSLTAFYRLLKYGEEFSISDHIDNLKEWLRFRRITVTEFLKAYVKRIKAQNPNLETGIYIFTPSLSDLVGQSYEDLSSYFDFFSPMIYRHFKHPSGPACLDHEISAILGYGEGKNEDAKNTIRETFIRLTGVDYFGFGTRESLKEEGLPPETVGAETKKAADRSCGRRVIPIILLDDDRLERSLGQISNLVDEIDFYVYDKTVFDKAIAVLKKFS
ncbi:MAG: hypothetical protein ACOX3Q_09000 [Clostridia bacterium]|jgi:hypothetical protein